MFSQKDVEKYFSEIAQQMLGLQRYKPSERMVEARAQRTDFSYHVKHKKKEERGYAIAGSNRKYELCEFNEDHNVAEWFDSGLALDLASEEYLTFEQGISLTARKVARVTLLCPIRSLFGRLCFRSRMR
mmetsp:Transcript_29455/g.86058  ORF Transcript_29455/g.86058 Transcript_29455/m.86058 type:complete len:129 (-) Transcript_29455:274-660(-)